MPGPIDSLRFVHAAILREACRVDDLVHSDLTRKQAKVLAGEVAFFADLVDKHTRGEEVGLFPALAESEPLMAQTYLHDHEEERAAFARVRGLLLAFAETGAGLAELRRESTALRVHQVSHVEKENTIVLPHVSAHFDVPSQALMVQKILSTIPPAEMAKVVPWLVNHLDDDMANAYVGVLSQAMPPPVFEMAKGWIRSGCAPERVSVLAALV
jgi:hypothetical protein